MMPNAENNSSLAPLISRKRHKRTASKYCKVSPAACRALGRVIWAVGSWFDCGVFSRDFRASLKYLTYIFQ